jgi:TPR repeat protein
MGFPYYNGLSMVRPLLVLALFGMLGASQGARSEGAQGPPLPAARDISELQRRAGAGDLNAAVALGTLYEAGDGVAEDRALAAAWYLKAATAGHTAAQINLAAMYLDGAGVPRDPAAAVAWLRRAAERGDTTAQFTLGTIFETGLGTSAAAGPATGAAAGTAAVKRDAAQAASWYRQAADRGLMPAQTRLARMYEEGRGVRRNRDHAAAWYRKAADQDDPAAQLALGALLSPGNGARTDVVAAHMWLNLSASRWKDEALRQRAAGLRDALEQRMTRTQLSEATRRSLVWQDTVGMRRK